MKKNTTVRLLGILALLVVLYILIQFLGNNKRSASFREELVEIDTAKVTSISIIGEDTLSLTQEDNQWMVTLASGKKVKAEETDVNNMINNLLTIKPARVAAKNEDKWKDYAVDSAGTRVIVKEGQKETLDMVIGRFGMEGQRKFFTYVRLFDEPEVYVANDFMGMSISTDPSAFRNNDLLNLNKDSLTAINFNYPDSAFSLEKSISGKWVIDGQEADSASMAKYLNQIRYLSSRDFVDDDIDTSVQLYQISFNEGPGQSTLNVFDHKGQLVFQSSENQEALFGGQSLREKVIKSKEFFLSGEQK